MKIKKSGKVGVWWRTKDTRATVTCERQPLEPSRFLDLKLRFLMILKPKLLVELIIIVSEKTLKIEQFWKLQKIEKRKSVKDSSRNISQIKPKVLA